MHPRLCALLAVMSFVWLVGSGCGQPDAPRLGMKVQLLDASQLKQVRFLDVGLFDGSKVDCDQITVVNYLSDVEPIRSARLNANPNTNETIVPLDVIDGKASLADGLIEGQNLVVFVVALSLSGQTKTKIASGCLGNVNLSKGKITKVPILLKPIQ